MESEERVALVFLIEVKEERLSPPKAVALWEKVKGVNVPDREFAEDELMVAYDTFLTSVWTLLALRWEQATSYYPKVCESRTRMCPPLAKMLKELAKVLGLHSNWPSVIEFFDGAYVS